MASHKLQHEEIEVKFRADAVSPRKLGRWLTSVPSAQLLRYKTVEDCPDFYYVGPNGEVIRHRFGEKGGTFTIKARKSKKSTTNRHEVDLGLNSSLSEATQFIKLLGFKRSFVIMKDSWIWKLEDEETSAHVTVALYDVVLWNPEKAETTGKPQRFLEVEIEKGTYDSSKEALCLLEGWIEDLQQADLGLSSSAEQLSLYELFSGNRYNVIKD